VAAGGVERAEQVESLGAGAAGLGLVDDELLAGSVPDVERLVGEGERADVRVQELLGVQGLAAHGVGLPQPGELRAVLGEGADEFAQPRIVRVESGCLAQIGHGGLGRAVPVHVEVPAGGVEEGHAGQVVRRIERGVQRVGQGVGGEEVQGPVDDEHRSVRIAVHQLTQHGADPFGSVAGGPFAGGGSGHPEQMGAGLLVEAQRPAEGVEHLG
jgi:hypothetical protein